MVKKMGYSNIMTFSLALYAVRILAYSLFTQPGKFSKFRSGSEWKRTEAGFLNAKVAP